MYNNSKEIIKNIEMLIKNNELTSKEELTKHLTDLKDRGILTQAQINANIEELSKLYDKKRDSETNFTRMATRTPQRQDYQGSEGFSRMGFLVFIMMSFALLGIMLTLLNK